MAEKRKLRIGVFGGARGQTMISVLLHHPDAQLVAVCDKYVPLLDEAKKTAEECGTEIAVFERFDDFIEYDMDAVVLANYATEHATFAIRCMNKGKHVLSEVLPCETMAQAVELIETVEKTGLVYAYAENYCYMTHTFNVAAVPHRGDGHGTVRRGRIHPRLLGDLAADHLRRTGSLAQPGIPLVLQYALSRSADHDHRSAPDQGGRI